MPRFVTVLACAGLAVLAACGAPQQRFAAPPAPPGDRIAIPVRFVQLREVSLPAYARDEEIWVEGEGGALSPQRNLLWADAPERGVTQELARQLAAITGATVAAEPWPFDSLPQATVELRLDTFLAGRDGRFRVAGQYFVAGQPALRDRSGTFEVAAPIAPESGVPGIAAARASALRDLARLIAREGL
jgi:uncharacterized lipoprotein YmbA